MKHLHLIRLFRRGLLCGSGLLCMALGATLLCPAFAQAQTQPQAQTQTQAQVLPDLPYAASLEEAMAAARKTRKPVFVNCYAAWAGGSRLMDSVVLRDPALSAFICLHFVPLRLDMTATPEGRAFAKTHGVKTYAHFLVLEADGSLRHRIVGGSQAPAFQKLLAQSLKDKSSLAGMEKRYQKGERSQAFLRDYAQVLRVADDARYKEVAQAYLDKASDRELQKAPAWPLLRHAAATYDSPWYNYVYTHRRALEKANGPQVYDLLLGAAIRTSLDYMLYRKDYDPDFSTKLTARARDLETDKPAKDQLLGLYRILELRHHQDYDPMLDLWETLVPGLDNILVERNFDATLGGLPALSEAQRTRIAAYLRKRMEGKQGTTLETYRTALAQLTQTGGMDFFSGSLAAALDKARQEGKYVFVDCYTSWCGPCKIMARNVFPSPTAGAYFNPAFVNLKIDMEQGEGPDLARQWGVKAYPTYVILDAQGQVVLSLSGAMPAEALVDKVRQGLQKP